MNGHDQSQYDPLYAYTQTPARVAGAADITTLTSFPAPQSATSALDYGSPLLSYEPYRYPTTYYQYGSAGTAGQPSVGLAYADFGNFSASVLPRNLAPTTSAGGLEFVQTSRAGDGGLIGIKTEFDVKREKECTGRYRLVLFP
ncbi:hypothetical protein AAVH_19537 [Aphelenchoides avenae]|nr:hypothetical protein AAVH_19537 [Aphelenchus avenae]